MDDVVLDFDFPTAPGVPSVGTRWAMPVWPGQHDVIGRCNSGQRMGRLRGTHLDTEPLDQRIRPPRPPVPTRSIPHDRAIEMDAIRAPPLQARLARRPVPRPLCGSEEARTSSGWRSFVPDVTRTQ
jgi:hypothetical protein